MNKWLTKKNWLELIVSIQDTIFEEAEYYGIYEPNIINVACSMIIIGMLEYSVVKILKCSILYWQKDIKLKILF